MMITTEDGYSICCYKNSIQIGLPQTFRTVTNSMSPVVDRKECLTDGEQIMILELVRRIMNKEEKPCA